MSAPEEHADTGEPPGEPKLEDLLTFVLEKTDEFISLFVDTDVLTPADLIHLAATCTAARTIFLSNTIWWPKLKHFKKRETACFVTLNTALAEDLPLRPDGVFPGGPGWKSHPANVGFADSLAYPTFKALHDSKRACFTHAELTSFEELHFRFKKAAGQYWVENDAWWNNAKPTRVRLLPDGTVQLHDFAGHLWGRAGRPAPIGTDEVAKWRIDFDGTWGSRLMPLSIRATDAATIIHIEGQPPFVVKRHPVHHGVYLDSEWCLLSAFPLAPRGTDPAMDMEDVNVLSARRTPPSPADRLIAIHEEFEESGLGAALAIS